MTIDEAIKQHEAIAAEQRELYGLCPCPCNGLTDCKCLESGKDKGCMKLHYEHQQLAEWLRELRKAKRLLGEALRTLNDGSCNKDCRQCKWNENGCEMSCRFAWRYGDEVSALIGDENDAE